MFSNEFFLRLFRRYWEALAPWKVKKKKNLLLLRFYHLPPSGKGQAPVFNVFEAFLNMDNIQVFANAATSYIMCLMKFVKGLGKWNPPLIIHGHCRPFSQWFCRDVPGDRTLKTRKHPRIWTHRVRDLLGFVDVFYCIYKIYYDIMHSQPTS